MLLNKLLKQFFKKRAFKNNSYLRTFKAVESKTDLNSNGFIVTLEADKKFLYDFIIYQNTDGNIVGTWDSDTFEVTAEGIERGYVQQEPKNFARAYQAALNYLLDSHIIEEGDSNET